MRAKLLLVLFVLLFVTVNNRVIRAADVNIPDGDVAALIAAIRGANEGTSSGGIALAPGGTYTLTVADNGENGLPVIGVNISIYGNGATIRRAAGSPNFRFFSVSAYYSCEVEEGGCTTHLDLQNLTLSGGSVSAGYGGAILNNGSLQMSNVVLDGNSSQTSGGALYNTADLIIYQSTFSNNVASGGGAIYNTAPIFNNVVIINSTFSHNTNYAIENTGKLYISNSTFANNATTLWNRSGHIDLESDLLATDNAHANCQVDGGRIGSGAAYPSLESGNSCGFDQSGGISNVDPLLGPLANNGGATPTHALLPGSPAIDTGMNCQAADQRGQARPTDGNGDGYYQCDIGAFEVAGSGTAFINPQFTPGFQPEVIAVGENSQLHFTIINPNTSIALTEVAFKADFDPNVLVIANTSNLQNTCGGTPDFAPGGNFIHFTNGTVAASSTCELSVTVTGVAEGVYSDFVTLITHETGSSLKRVVIMLQVGGYVDTTTPPDDGADPTVSACADLDGSTNPVVQVNVPPGLWGVYCRVISDNPAEIGNEEVLQMGVLQAIDVFSPNGENLAGMRVCLQGIGSIVFLDASQSPRVPQVLASTTDGGYTCAVIPGAGLVVLVSASQSAPPASAPVGQPASNSVLLSGCQVMTTHMVRLRAEPDTNSAVITTLPYEINLTATDRKGEWFHVVYLDGQGWVSGTYLTTNTSC